MTSSAQIHSIPHQGRHPLHTKDAIPAPTLLRWGRFTNGFSFRERASRNTPLHLCPPCLLQPPYVNPSTFARHSMRPLSHSDHAFLKEAAPCRSTVIPVCFITTINEDFHSIRDTEEDTQPCESVCNIQLFLPHTKGEFNNDSRLGGRLITPRHRAHTFTFRNRESSGRNWGYRGGGDRQCNALPRGRPIGVPSYPNHLKMLLVHIPMHRESLGH